jgi:hypothetical protein
LSNIISCGKSQQPQQPAEDINTDQSGDITEDITETPVVLNADELYDLIISNKTVWEREEMIGGTLIDLDFDGMPEFLLMTGQISPSLTAFKIEGGGLKEIKHIEHIYVPENVFGEFKAILPYTDESGVKSWVLPYISDQGYRLSAFDFTGENITETVKFNSEINYDAELSEKYYGYEYLDAHFYIDGTEHKAPQDITDAFMIELDKIVSEADEMEANGELAAYPWSCGRHYPTPSQVEWEESKTNFLNGLLAVEPAYNLFPGFEGDYYTLYDENNIWKNEENLGPALKRLTEAYCVGNDEFLRTKDLIYDNGGAMCKPVIYLYPDKETDISVRVDFSDGGRFTCTYPDYKNGWNVTAYPDGTLINKSDGLEYSYLYWEGEGNVNWDFSSGFVVKGGDTASFLREKLAYLGLTPREYNEFIVYWLPLMQNNKYNLIAFQNSAYEKSAALYISPTPDNVLRVFMAYKPLENIVEIPKQKLDRFERYGFCAIEWGGTCVN